MTHSLITVFIEREHALTEQTRAARLAEMLSPYDEREHVVEYEVDCIGWAPAGEERVHASECCGGRLKERVRGNPKGHWDYYTPLSDAAGEPCWGLVLPDEGWFDQLDFNRGVWPGCDERLKGWDEIFTAAFERYSAEGYVPVLVNCHS